MLTHILHAYIHGHAHTTYIHTYQTKGLLTELTYYRPMGTLHSPLNQYTHAQPDRFERKYWPQLGEESLIKMQRKWNKQM